jgi:hypothetical protein
MSCPQARLEPLGLPIVSSNVSSDIHRHQQQHLDIPNSFLSFTYIDDNLNSDCFGYAHFASELPRLSGVAVSDNSMDYTDITGGNEIPSSQHHHSCFTSIDNHSDIVEYLSPKINRLLLFISRTPDREVCTDASRDDHSKPTGSGIRDAHILNNHGRCSDGRYLLSHRTPPTKRYGGHWYGARRRQHRGYPTGCVLQPPWSDYLRDRYIISISYA